MSEETTVKRGRPTVEGSARQMRLTARAERVANGGSVERGRPTNSSSARQQRLADRQAKIAAGIEIKRGAPKKVTVEVVA